MANRQHENLHWDKIIFAILKYKSYTAAAAALGVSRVTVWRHTQLPAFRHRWFQAQASVCAEARAELEAHACEAAAAVIQIMNDPKVKAADRLRAAGYILGQRPTGLPLDDVELDDFEPDSLGLDTEIPVEPGLCSIDQLFDTRPTSESGEQPDKPLMSEQRTIVEELVKEVVARRQSPSAEAPKTSTGAGPRIESVSTFSPMPSPSTHPPTPIAPIPQPNPSTKATPTAPELKPTTNLTTRPESNPQPKPVAPATGDQQPNPPMRSATHAAGSQVAPAAPSTIPPGRPSPWDPSTDPATPMAGSAAPNLFTNPPTPAAAKAGGVPERPHSPNRTISAEVTEAQLRARESIQKVLECEQPRQRR
jgi:hypothetical protein